MFFPRLTIGRRGLALRTGVVLALALLIFLLAWQMLSGLRFSLPRREAPRPPATVDATLPVQPPTQLPARRAQAQSVGPAPAEHATAGAPAAAPPAERAAARGAHPAPAAESKRAAAAQKPEAAPAAPEAAPAPSTPPPPAPPPQTAVAAASPPAAVAPSPTAAPAGAATGQPAPVARGSALPPHAPMQVVLPRSARLVYTSYATVRVGGFALPVRGRTTMRWQFQDGRYQSDLSINVINYTQSSEGRFDPDVGLEPERFTEKRPRRPLATTQFDWANRRVSFTEEAPPGDAEPGIQDRLSIQFQLSVLRQVYPELFVRGTVVPITLAGTHDVSHWTFTVTGDEVVDSGLGHLPAVRVLSTRTTSSGDESLEVWICEQLHWFPARIRMVDKNRNVLDFVIDEATMN